MKTIVSKSDTKYHYDLYELNELLLWINKFVEFQPLITTSFKQCFENYTTYLSSERGVVPLSKRRFSVALKDNFKDYIDVGKVKFITKSNLLIKGVKLK